MRDFELAVKAVGDPTRTRILKLLQEGGLCGCQLQEVLGLAASTVSKHLSLLKMAGLVRECRDGRWVEYALASPARNPHAEAVLQMLLGLLEDDPVILADRQALLEVRAVPRADFCSSPSGRKSRKPARVKTSDPEESDAKGDIR
jgi:DNA-binding transcriptional ArsR family regulator